MASVLIYALKLLLAGWRLLIVYLNARDNGQMIFLLLIFLGEVTPAWVCQKSLPSLDEGPNKRRGARYVFDIVSIVSIVNV